MKKMNKAFRICWALGIAIILAGCGEAASAGNMQQNISADFSGQSDAGKDNKGNETDPGSEISDQDGKKEEKGAFRFVYEGVVLIPGEVFEESSLGTASAVSEVPSCAFDGNDRVYNYEKFELTAYIDGNQERIYSIYFMDPNLPTTEGLCLGDPVDDMKAFYGEDCEMNGTAYVYTRGNSLLSIVTQNDIVVGIEYRLNR